MKRNKLIFLNLILVSLIFSACNEVLNELPDNRTEIDSPDKIGELLVGAYPEAAYAPFLQPRTDNATDKGLGAVQSDLNTFMYEWDDIFTLNSDTPTNYWNAAYAAIAQANQALASIEALGGGSELDAYRGEALVCRAYAHFMLVNIWAKTYDPATAATDLGVPYVTEPENQLFQEYTRNSVQEVYDNIESDLETGLPLLEDNYRAPAFHFTPRAGYAFASRFYLFTGNWEKVIEYSDKVLGIDPSLVIRDWANGYNTLTFGQISTRYSNSNPGEEPANLLLVSAGSLFDRTYFSQRYQLSNTLRGELFGAGNPTGSGWTYRVFGRDLSLNIPKFLEFFRITNQAAGIGFPFVAYVLLSTDEVLLNRAEAHAMLGNLDLALADMDTFLSVNTQNYDPEFDRISTNILTFFYRDNVLDYDPFYEIPSESMVVIHALQEFRRRAFYQEGLRWFDIRRFNLSITHLDFLRNIIGVLESQDNRKQLQIPNDAIASGIEENPR